MSDVKAAIHGNNMFHLNIIIIVICKVFFHATEKLKYPSGSSSSRYCVLL